MAHIRRPTESCSGCNGDFRSQSLSALRLGASCADNEDTTVETTRSRTDVAQLLRELKRDRRGAQHAPTSRAWRPRMDSNHRHTSAYFRLTNALHELLGHLSSLGCFLLLSFYVKFCLNGV